MTVSTGTRKALVALSKKLQRTQKSILVQAIRLYELAVNEKAKGNRLLVVDASLEPVVKIVGI